MLSAINRCHVTHQECLPITRKWPTETVWKVYACFGMTNVQSVYKASLQILRQCREQNIIFTLQAIWVFQHHKHSFSKIRLKFCSRLAISTCTHFVILLTTVIIFRNYDNFWRNKYFLIFNWVYSYGNMYFQSFEIIIVLTNLILFSNKLLIRKKFEFLCAIKWLQEICTKINSWNV